MNFQPHEPEHSREYLDGVVAANRIARKAKLLRIASGRRIWRYGLSGFIGLLVLAYASRLSGFAFATAYLSVFGILTLFWEASSRIDAIVELLEDRENRDR